MTVWQDALIAVTSRERPANFVNQKAIAFTDRLAPEPDRKSNQGHLTSFEN